MKTTKRQLVRRLNIIELPNGEFDLTRESACGIDAHLCWSNDSWLLDIFEGKQQTDSIAVGSKAEQPNWNKIMRELF